MVYITAKEVSSGFCIVGLVLQMSFARSMVLLGIALSVFERGALCISFIWRCIEGIRVAIH